MEIEEKIRIHTFTDTGTGVIRALAYSSVFSYPLKRQEIFEKLPFPMSDVTRFDNELKKLCDHRVVIQKEGHFYLSDPTQQIVTRAERNHRARRYMGTARFISRFIGAFPYVRAVFLSGSISKDCMDKDGDIDYFIITEPGRLWVCRTLLIAFKKVFLFNSYKFFCLNYFIDSAHLEIADRNIYTANEIKTLVPTYGREWCERFFKANAWTDDFLPNTPSPVFTSAPASGKNGMKWLLEKLLSPAYGNRLDTYFRQVSEKYWQRKFGHLNRDELREITVSSASQSAHHPENFKRRVLARYHSVLREMELRYDIRFS